MATKKLGRSKGRRTKGYFFRTGRGWYTKKATRFVPLCYEDGTHIKDENADEQDVQEAHARFVLDTKKAVQVQEQTTVFAVCDYYLADTNELPQDW